MTAVPTDWRADPASAGCAVMRTAHIFRDAGLSGPERDSRILVGAAAGIDQARLLASPDLRLEPQQERALADCVRRRLAREPVSRILGQRGFFGREFAVTPATLDPRPDSETLIEAVLELVSEEEWAGPLRVLDIGTGSGCLLVTILAELPGATGVGVDIESGALLTAKDNAERHGVAARASFICEGDLDALAGDFDIIVTNPPYVPTAEIVGLEPEVRDYDPLVALDGGPDGLDFYRRIARNLPRLAPEGWALLEVGAGQADAVCDVLVKMPSSSGEADVRRFRDLDGRDRCVAWKARRTRVSTKSLGIQEAPR